MNEMSEHKAGRELDTRLIRPRFTLDGVISASLDWGVNCGPAALAVVAKKTLQELRPFLGDFERKRYTNPTMMFDSLRRLGINWRQVKGPSLTWPQFGVVRVQWCGPWTAPGVPPRVAYRHTHWVAAQRLPGQLYVFDVNAMSVGGWIPEPEWREHLVPWLLKECEPKANGYWFLTHVIEIELGKSLVGCTIPARSEER
jgi:hypothetical protein